MKITFWGAARTVTGSQHLLEVGRERVLLDCGFFQGRRAESYAVNRQLPFEARRIDAMILSHAHIDHCGNVPNLVKSGFSGDIFCTHATRDLAATMLRDSGAIQEEDAYFLNKRRRGNEAQIEPIYGVADAERAMKQFVSVDYGHRMQVTSGVRAVFQDAGHMLGSASELLELSEGGRTVRLCFSGDLGRHGLPILRDPEPMPAADYLILESTYGGRTHPPIASVDEDLCEAITAAAERGGKVVIPAFAVGRTQELVYRLNVLMNDGRLPEVPVFVDSPLAVNVTEAFRAHFECYDDEIRAELRNDPDGGAFGFKRLTYVRTVEQSKSINFMPGPAVIISASGMCENGRVLHHLRNTIEDARNMILFVSFQGPETLGSRIVGGERYVRILGDEFTVRAEVRRIEAFSGHADHGDLLRWVEPHAATLRGVFLVHGEPRAQDALAEGLRGIGVREVFCPRRGDVHELSQ
jgi:metallo-beta-lactamase family protein